jgi:hypothetical protein
MADRSIRDPSAPPLRGRRPGDFDQARPMVRRDVRPRPVHDDRTNEVDESTPARPDRRPTDRRRLLAATASSVIPGVGQALNGRLRPALLFAAPTFVAVGIVYLIAQSDRPTMLMARMVAPSVLGLLLTLNLIVLV